MNRKAAGPTATPRAARGAAGAVPARHWLEPRAAIFKALGHPTRLLVVERLERSAHCVCELTELVGADTSTVSKHLSVLKAAGLVYSTKQGTTVYYHLTCSCLSGMLDAAESILERRARETADALSTGQKTQNTP
jgi:ArsR family transcriptional regulator